MHIRWGPGPGRTANVAVRGRADIPPAAPHTETISCGSLKGQVAISEKPTGYTSASKNRNNSRPPWTNSRGPTRAKERFEYTVIGEPVNEAARLSELARSEPSRALASATTVAAASEREQRFWRLGKPVRLRGYDERVQIASLIGGS